MVCSVLLIQWQFILRSLMSMPKLTVKRLQDRIADAQHDIESIGIHIASQNESSMSLEQIQGLRGLQEMYRKRIVNLHAKIASVPAHESTTQVTQKDAEGLLKLVP
jgi:hypothetical protein